MTRSLLSVAAFLGLCFFAHGEEKTKTVERIGDICVLDAAEEGQAVPRKVTWSVLWPAGLDKWQTADGRHCVVATSVTSTVEDPIRVQAIKWGEEDVVIWSIVVGGVAPPPGPGPGPGPGPVPTTWAEKVRARLAAMPPADRANANVVAAAYSQAAALCGTQAYTGPDIRAAIDEKVKPVATTPAWLEMVKWINIEQANWEREKWRNWQAYQERTRETAQGLGAVASVPLSYTVPMPLLQSVHNSKPIVLGDRAFIVDGQAYERRCENGSCSYVPRGAAGPIRYFDGRPYVVSQ